MYRYSEAILVLYAKNIFHFYDPGEYVRIPILDLGI